jgi:hypothetical protein
MEPGKLLTIQEGGSRREVRLTAEELRTQRTEYYPQSGNVVLRLEVQRAAGQFTGETVQVATGLGEPAPAPKPIRIERRSVVASAPPSRTRGRADRRAIADPRRPAAPRQFTAARRLPSRPPATLLPEPPPASPQGAPLAQPVRLASPVLPARGAEAPPVRFVAAIPVRKVSPAAPVDLRAAIRDNVAVDVEVTIDAAGRVLRATPVEAVTASQRLLAPHAAQAASMWTFRPASRDGKPVESRLILRFDFTRPVR